MKTATFKPSDLVSVLSFLENFKTTCDSNNIHKNAAVWLSQYFILELVKVASSHLVTADNQKKYHYEVSLTTFCEMAGYLL